MPKETPKPLYKVVRDTREQRGWEFPSGPACAGTEVKRLPTGDYTLVGYEKVFVIERKGTMAEFSQNLSQARFNRELDRLDAFEHPYLILEFDMRGIIHFPEGSGIPTFRTKYLRQSPQFLMKRFHEVQLAHPKLHIIFAGSNGREVASSLFKRIVEHYGKE